MPCLIFRVKLMRYAKKQNWFQKSFHNSYNVMYIEIDSEQESDTWEKLPAKAHMSQGSKATPSNRDGKRQMDISDLALCCLTDEWQL